MRRPSTVRRSLPPLGRAAGGGLELQVGHQQQVDDMEGVVGLDHDDRSTARNRHDEIAMWDRNLAAIRQVDDEGLERLGLVSGPHLLDGHGEGVRIGMVGRGTPPG